MAEMTHASLRALLEQERDRLRGQLAQYGHGDGASLAFDEGFADSGQVTAERGEVEALVASLLGMLKETEAALEKFEAGTYGACESCGEPISPLRLEAQPAARYCIECASKRS
ncbi:MAG TPA: TraR/DksA C4-type zinc finger protein [Acidimicrobiia bacterium]|nr:TraR/DksA C4-type zinc finger protein [Acidimicrobiia bacterium]